MTTRDQNNAQGPTGKARRPRPTMMDVAARAGVSQATVSLVLNGSTGSKLSEATRRRVKRAADELGYTLVRRSPKKDTGSPSVILFMADEIVSDPWMALAFDGAQKKATEMGYSAVLAVTNGDPELEATVARQAGDKRLAGIIYGTILTRQVAPSEAVMEGRTVLLNCYDEGRKLHSIIPGDLLGGRTATQHLIDAGHKRIAFINGQRGLDGSHERLKGYKQALASNDIGYDPALVKQGNWEPASGYTSTRELLAMDTPPDAIFCGNDMMAHGCYCAISEAGLRIPNDIAVIGFDDREIAKSMHPPLSTLILPQFEMGEIAAEIVIEMAGGHNMVPVQTKVECTLVARESV